MYNLTPKTESAKQEVSGFSKFCFEWLETIAQVMFVLVLMMHFFVRPFTVDGRSMQNTLQNGDKLLVQRFGDYEPKQGDIAVISEGAQHFEPIVKRIIALEGQKIEVDYKHDRVLVDGKMLDEPYKREKMIPSGYENFPEIVPEGKIFVMGDNRNHSTDSRDPLIGIIPKEKVVGPVIFRWWAYNEEGKLDFSKIGRVG